MYLPLVTWWLGHAYGRKRGPDDPDPDPDV